MMRSSFSAPTQRHGGGTISCASWPIPPRQKLPGISFKVTRATYGKLLLIATKDIELVAKASAIPTVG